MRKPMTLLLCLAAAIAVGAFAASAASAATTLGNTCVGNRAEKPQTLVQLAKTSTANPLVAPEAGVITKWGVSVIPYPGGISETLKVLHPVPGKNTFTVVAESTSQPIVGGANTFDTRLPIQAGDRIGVSASTLTIFCTQESGSTPTDVMGFVEGDQGVNSTAAYTEAPGAQAAVTATIEKDVDGDGFGDETQDKCPQNAAVQIPCPVLNLDAISQPPGKSAVRIVVTSGSDSSITVSASAKITSKTKKAKASAQANLAPVTQLVTPGKLAIYTINFTKRLKDALAALPRKKTLALAVAVAGKTIDGAASSEKKLTVKLKGQAKEARH
jgi:hypothetical protein